MGFPRWSLSLLVTFACMGWTSPLSTDNSIPINVSKASGSNVSSASGTALLSYNRLNSSAKSGSVSKRSDQSSRLGFWLGSSISNLPSLNLSAILSLNFLMLSWTASVCFSGSVTL